MKRKRSAGCLLLTLSLATTLLLPGCSSKAVTAKEPAIPASYATYNDAMGLFSISYPPDWKITTSLQPEIEQSVMSAVKSAADSAEHKSYLLLRAVAPDQSSYLPSLAVSVESLSPSVSTHDQRVEAQVNHLVQTLSEYREISRVETTVGGKQASVIEWEGVITQTKFHVLWTLVLVGRNAWVVSCDFALEESSRWEGDFQAMARSLRILK